MSEKELLVTTDAERDLDRAIDSVALIGRGFGGGGENGQDLMVFSGHDGYAPERGLRAVLKALGFTAENNARNNPRPRYVNSRMWRMYRAKDADGVDVRVDVGCACEHDCCGHICYLSYRITRHSGETWIVTRSWGRNY